MWSVVNVVPAFLALLSLTYSQQDNSTTEATRITIVEKVNAAITEKVSIESVIVLNNTNSSSTTAKGTMRNYGNGFSLTPEEEVAVDKFRKMVEPLLYRTPMVGDNYLIKFIRAKDMNLNEAASMLKKTVEWRKANKIDTILTENFTRWEKLFPFIIDGFGKEGRPIFYLPISKYDVRKAVIAGHTQTLGRLYDYSFEKGTRIGYRIFETTGKNAALEGILIMDLNGFNLRQHACIGCIPVFLRIVENYESYYPQHIHKAFMINAHPSIELILQVVRPLMSKHTNKALEVYGSDKNIWMPVLKKYIDDDQLAFMYGGTRATKVH